MAPVVESLKKRYTGAWGKLNVVADSAIFTGFVLGCVAFAPDQLPGGAEPDCPAGSTFKEVTVNDEADAFTDLLRNFDVQRILEREIEKTGLSNDNTVFTTCNDNEENSISNDLLGNAGPATFTIEPEKTPELTDICSVSTPDAKICFADFSGLQGCYDTTALENYLHAFTQTTTILEETEDAGFGDFILIWLTAGTNIISQYIQDFNDLPANEAVKIDDDMFAADCSSLYDNMYALVTAAVSVALAGNVLCLVGRIGNRDETSGWVLGTAYVLYFIPLGLAYGYIYSSDLPGTPVTRQQTAAGLTVGVTALHFVGGAIEASGGFGGGTMLVGSHLDAVRLLRSGAL